MSGKLVGQPDGYGRDAILDVDDDGRLICHECGRGFNQLATHVRLVHHTSAAQYRLAHGLGSTTRLVSGATSQKLAAPWTLHAAKHLADLTASRDSLAAAKHSLSHTKDRQWAPQVRALRADVAARTHRGRPLTPGETALLAEQPGLQEWADAARQIMTDPAVSTRSIADASGIAPPTVSQRLRRYPPAAR